MNILGRGNDKAGKPDAKAFTAEINQAAGLTAETVNREGRRNPDVMGNVARDLAVTGLDAELRQDRGSRGGYGQGMESGQIDGQGMELGQSYAQNQDQTRRLGSAVIASGEILGSEPERVNVPGTQGTEWLQRAPEMGPFPGEGLRNAETEIRRDQAELTKAGEFVGDESEIESIERAAEDAENAQLDAGKGLSFEVKAMRDGQEQVARKVVPVVDELMKKESYKVGDLVKVYGEGVRATLGVFGRSIGDRN